MSNILCVHQQVDFTIYRDGHLGGYNVIFGIGVVVHIESEEILLCFLDHLGMNRAELSIWAGIAKIEGELSSLHLHRHSIRGGCSEIDGGPGFGAESSQGQDLGTD